MTGVIDNAIGVTIPLLIFYIGYLIERRKNKIERTHEVRIEFNLEGSVLGEQAGSYLVDLSVVLHNKGLVKHEIQDLHLKALGIEQQTDIDLFDEFDTGTTTNLIARFPIPLVSTDVLQLRKVKDRDKPKKAYFIESGVEQRISYVALIPKNIRFILVRAQFKYHEKSTHSAQKAFALGAETETTGQTT